VRVLLIGVAGAAGALTRYGIATAAASAGGPRAFPWTTLAINLVGSFLLGVLVELTAGDSPRFSDDVRLVLGVGFLGAFTTFSTFSVESVQLLRDGRAAEALVYVGASVAGGLALAALGWGVAMGFVLCAARRRCSSSSCSRPPTSPSCRPPPLRSPSSAAPTSASRR
jgi:CrcB protein